MSWLAAPLALVYQLIFLGPLISLTSSKKMGLLLHKANKGMDFMKELLEAGKVKPVIDRRYPLREVAEALRYFAEGHAKGKIVITLEQNNKKLNWRITAFRPHLYELYFNDLPRDLKKRVISKNRRALHKFF